MINIGTVYVTVEPQLDAGWKSKFEAATRFNAPVITVRTVIDTSDLNKIPSEREMTLNVDVDMGLAFLKLKYITRRRKVVVDVELNFDPISTALFSLIQLTSVATTAAGAIAETGEAVAETASAVSGGFEAASTVMEGFANIFESVSSVAKGVGSAIGSALESVAKIGATVVTVITGIISAIATAPLTIALLALAAAAITATLAISALAAVMGVLIAIFSAAVIAAGIFITATLAAGAAAGGLALAVGGLVAAIGLLPGAIAAATGGLVVLLLVFAPLMKAFSAFMGLQGKSVKVGKNVAKARKDEAAQERNLAKARQDSRDELERLNKAAADAARQQDQAGRGVLSAASRAAAISASATATAQERLDAELALRDAQDQAAAANANKLQADKDLAAAQKKGIAGSQKFLDAQADIADVTAASSSELDAYNDALKALSPAGRRFQRTLEKIFAILDPLSKLLQEATFPGLTSAATAFGELFGTIGKGGAFNAGPLTSGLEEIGTSISGVGDQLAALFKDETFIDSVKSLLGSSSELISSMGGPAVDFFGNVIEGISEFASKSKPIFDALGGALSGIGEALKQFFTDLSDPETIDAISGIIESIGSFLAGFIKILGPFLADLAVAIEPFLDDLKGPVLDLLKVALDAILQFLSGGILEGLVDFVKGISGALKKMTEPISGEAPIIDPGEDRRGHGSTPKSTEGGTTFIEQLSASMGELLTKLGELMPKIVEDLMPALVTLVDALSDNAEDIIDVAVAFAIVLAPILPDLVEDMINLTGQLAYLATDVMPLLNPLIEFLAIHLKILYWAIKPFVDLLKGIKSGALSNIPGPLGGIFKLFDLAVNATQMINPDAAAVGVNALANTATLNTQAASAGVGTAGARTGAVDQSTNTKNVNLNIYGDVSNEVDVDLIMGKLTFASLAL